MSTTHHNYVIYIIHSTQSSSYHFAFPEGFAQTHVKKTHLSAPAPADPPSHSRSASSASGWPARRGPCASRTKPTQPMWSCPLASQSTSTIARSLPDRPTLRPLSGRAVPVPSGSQPAAGGWSAGCSGCRRSRVLRVWSVWRAALFRCCHGSCGWLSAARWSRLGAWCWARRCRWWGVRFVLRTFVLRLGNCKHTHELVEAAHFFGLQGGCELEGSCHHYDHIGSYCFEHKASHQFNINYNNT